jgi:hypothetical protein
MSELDTDFGKDMQIDPNGLDVEWLEQPGMLMRYSKIAADMRLEMDLEKENLELVKARLDSDIRQNPEEFGILKVTEAGIAATIPKQTKYQSAHEEYLNARHDYDIAMAAVRACDQRKSALEALTRLLGLEYFSAPTSPRDLDVESHRRQKARNKIKSRRKK